MISCLFSVLRFCPCYSFCIRVPSVLTFQLSLHFFLFHTAGLSSRVSVLLPGFCFPAVGSSALPSSTFDLYSCYLRLICKFVWSCETFRFNKYTKIGDQKSSKHFFTPLHIAGLSLHLGPLILQWQKIYKGLSKCVVYYNIKLLINSLTLYL